MVYLEGETRYTIREFYCGKKKSPHKIELGEDQDCQGVQNQVELSQGTNKGTKKRKALAGLAIKI